MLARHAAEERPEDEQPAALRGEPLAAQPLERGGLGGGERGRVLRVLRAAVDVGQEAREERQGEERRVRQQELEEADLVRVSLVTGVDCTLWLM